MLAETSRLIYRIFELVNITLMSYYKYVFVLNYRRYITYAADI